MVNIARNWGATNLLSPVRFDIVDDFPFSFVPKNKISAIDLMNVLKHHYEGTELEYTNVKSPHKSETLPICRKDTQYGMIAQLRNWLPSDIGNIMWIAPYRPCSQVFIPWYYGISKIPSEYNMGDYKSALENHFMEYEDIKKQTSFQNFWMYVEFADHIDDNYYKLMPKVIAKKNATQQDIFKTFDEFDSNIYNQYIRNHKRAIKYLDFFMKDMFEISIKYLKQ
jgi:dipeptidase